MKMHIVGPLAAAVGLGAAALLAPSLAQQADMSFFVTSVGTGKGADLGGLAGADAHCQSLAQAAGAGGKTWRAYLSTQAQGGQEGGQAAINAKDRIGKGPWKNAKGQVIADDVADLHSGEGAPKLTKEANLNEKGESVQYAAEGIRTQHDILTGTQMDGTAFPPGEDRTCGNWTKSGEDGIAMLGHADRRGLSDTVEARSWNASHVSRGCHPQGLISSGGAGLFYCFAAQ